MPLDREDGEIVFDIDINAMEQALKGTGWTTGWAVTPVSGQLKVSVAEGSGRSEGTVKSTTGATEIALDAAHATYPRKDLIVYDASASALGKVTGIPAAIDPLGATNPRKMKVPKPPDLGESTDIIIACVYVPANCTDADECTIIDKRVALPFGSDISDADAAVGDVKSGKTFYAEDYPKKTGTLALTEDTEGDLSSTSVGTNSQVWHDTHSNAVPAESDLDLCSKTLTYAADSLAFAVAFVGAAASGANILKFRLYMSGVQMQESGYISSVAQYNYVLRAFKALSGSQICKLSVHNYLTLTRNIQAASEINSAGQHGYMPLGIAIGSVKI